jgi:rhodanese-related sulfurtransferase
MFTWIIIAAVMAVALIFWIWSQRRSSTVFTLGQAASTRRIGPDQYQVEFVQSHALHLLVDVRTPEEFVGSHIAGAVNISLQSLPERLREIPRDRPIVLYCRSGQRSANALRLLTQSGYQDLYDLGGIIHWQRQGMPVQTPAR